ncbi:hypothetical protein M8J77_001933 [Diaphorina citri]|nr:hypothetical protein M8J77_001933 [Diaphorina citri]
MQPSDAAASRRMNISWYAAKWRGHALTQISLRQMRGQSTSRTLGEERFETTPEHYPSNSQINTSSSVNCRPLSDSFAQAETYVRTNAIEKEIVEAGV